MPYLIDGHNVIAALPDIDLEDEHDEAKLIMKLRAWFGRRRRKAIVVFDGGIPGGYARSLSTADVKVVFASRYHTNADRIIKERLGKLPDAGNWMVISSDREVLDNARRVGARVMTAQAFADLLSLPAEAGKEKPDAISAAEVAAWLKIFPEVEGAADPPPPRVARAKKKPHVSRKSSRSPVTHKKSEGTRGRTSSSIGAQLGQEPEVDRVRKSTRTVPEGEKPATISDEEVAEWLQVFHDPVESSVPKPTVRRRKPPSRRKTPLTVNKDTDGLSPDEVAGWLELFGGEPTDSPQERAQPEPDTQLASNVGKGSRRRSRKSRRWTKQKHKQAPVEEENTGADLTQEDLDLWHRMYGEGE